MNIGLIGVGAAVAFAAVGSGLGIGASGMATIGAWKKCFAQNKAAPFALFIFIGAPLTQTIYGFILMNRLLPAAAEKDPGLILGVGVFGGIAIGISAWSQGRVGASASDSLAETGKGFINYILAIGLVETIAIFVLVFSLGIVS